MNNTTKILDRILQLEIFLIENCSYLDKDGKLQYNADLPTYKLVKEEITFLQGLQAKLQSCLF